MASLNRVRSFPSPQKPRNQQINLETATKNQEHHQSSKSLVGAITKISSEIAQKFKLSIDVDAQHRCVWFQEKHLYVTARNLDGIIPCLVNPFLKSRNTGGKLQAVVK